MLQNDDKTFSTSCPETAGRSHRCQAKGCGKQWGSAHQRKHYFWRCDGRQSHQNRDDMVDNTGHNQSRNCGIHFKSDARSARDAAIEDGYVVSQKNSVDNLIREAGAVPPVNRSKQMLTDGSPVTDDHRELQANGQQKGYVVLSEDERKRGFARPIRDACRHLKCGNITTMSRALAETYARDPGFYSGTFCSTCRSHFPVGPDGEFTWYENDGSEGQKVGT